MVGIVVGCNLAAGAAPQDAMVLPPPPAVPRITAVRSPATSRLYEGQSVQDMSGYAEMTRPENFASEGAAITEVRVNLAGDVISAAQLLDEGMLAGFSVTVTDDTGHVQTFTTAPVTVEYRARVVWTTSNEASIDINPLVPDARNALDHLQRRHRIRRHLHANRRGPAQRCPQLCRHGGSQPCRRGLRARHRQCADRRSGPLGRRRRRRSPSPRSSAATVSTSPVRPARPTACRTPTPARN